MSSFDRSIDRSIFSLFSLCIFRIVSHCNRVNIKWRKNEYYFMHHFVFSNRTVKLMLYSLMLFNVHCKYARIQSSIVLQLKTKQKKNYNKIKRNEMWTPQHIFELVLIPSIMVPFRLFFFNHFCH